MFNKMSHNIKTTTAELVHQMLGESGESRQSSVRERDQKLVTKYLKNVQKFKSENRRVRKLKHMGHVRVVSWNVQSWTDVYHTDTLSEMVKLLAIKLNADVLCLQEVIWNECIKRAFGAHGYRLVGFHKAKESYEHGNAILARQTVRLVLTGVINLPQGIGEQRCAVIGTILDEKGVPAIQIVCLHLDVYDKTDATRVAELNAILTCLKEMEQINETILVGDFNAVRKDDYHPKQWHAMDRPTKVFDLLKDWFVHRPTPPFTVWSGLVVDHAVLSPTWNRYTTRMSPYFTNLSDHIPLVVDIMDVYSSLPT